MNPDLTVYVRPQLAGYVGFYWDRFDAWYEDGQKVDGPREIAGRCNHESNFAACYPELAACWAVEVRQVISIKISNLSL